MFNLHKLLSTTHKEQLITVISKTYSIVTNNRENGLKESKEHLLDRKHLQHIIDYSLTNIFQPKFQTENNNKIVFIITYNPYQKFDFEKIHSCLDRIKNKEFKTWFQRENIIIH